MKVVIEAGGGDYDELLDWERQRYRNASSKTEGYIMDKRPQEFDSHQRGWVYVQFEEEIKKSAEGILPKREEMNIKYNDLFWPKDWSKASPFNNFWLRFPECSPLMPWRCY